VISKDTDIEDIVNDYPELVRPLKDFGIACVVCGEPIWGTLKEIAKLKNIQNLDEIIDIMNNIIKKGTK
jgi:methionine synthase II (cobalamin-independent)